MTAHISSGSLTQIGLQIPRWGTKWRPCRVWLYLKHLYFISSAVAYCISPYVRFYAGLSCYSFTFSWSHYIFYFMLSWIDLKTNSNPNPNLIPIPTQSGIWHSNDSVLEFGRIWSDRRHSSICINLRYHDNYHGNQEIQPRLHLHKLQVCPKMWRSIFKFNQAYITMMSVQEDEWQMARG